jgi:polysaccharide deacetylase 2 family uncharacterized protein YibQ
LGSAVVLVSIVLVVLLAFLGFQLYTSKTTSKPSDGVPRYETYASSGTEAKVKDLDLRIYDALLALGVREENVVFSAVDTKAAGLERWTYSELAVRLEDRQPYERIKTVFSDYLSSKTPKPSIRFSYSENKGTTIDVSLEGHQTHRLQLSCISPRKLVPSTLGSLPRVAIIIDDMGYDREMAERFLELEGRLSFSVLPHSPFHEEIATSIHASGGDVILHLPMEPIEYPDIQPGHDALMSFMTPDERLEQLRRNLDAVPFIVGVNNHMGSKLTQDSSIMRQIFTVLKKRNLFFVDSVTSPNSCSAEVARLIQVKLGKRNVFLDHVQEHNTIRFQIKRLVSIANRRGEAIGIGHPYAVTWEVLNEELPKIMAQVNLVPISELVR